MNVIELKYKYINTEKEKEGPITDTTNYWFKDSCTGLRGNLFAYRSLVNDTRLALELLLVDILMT